MSSVDSQQNITENVTNIDEDDRTIFKTHRNGNYVTINKTGLEDIRLSPDARWLLAYALSRKEDWVFVKAHLVKVSGYERKKVTRMIDELIKFGYMHYLGQTNAKGSFGQATYHVFEVPEINPHFKITDVPKRDTGTAVPFCDSLKRDTSNNKTYTTTDPYLTNNNNNNKAPLPFPNQSKPRTPSQSQNLRGDYHTRHTKQPTIKNQEGDSVVVALFNRLNKIKETSISLHTLQNLVSSHGIEKVGANVRGLEIKASRAPGSVKEPGASLISSLKNNWILPTDTDIKKSSGETADEYLARMKAQDEEEARRQKEREESEAKQLAEFGKVLSPKERIAMHLQSVTERMNVT